MEMRSSWVLGEPRAKNHSQFKGRGGGTGADAVDAADEVGVGNGGVARLNGPHGLRQRAYGRGGVEYDLGAVEPVRHPVQGVMTAGERGDEEELI